jgi:hypothetical protein
MPRDRELDEGTMVNALVSSDEWMIECGRLSCDTLLAGVAWIDINFNMATNGAEGQGGALPFAELPPPHLRRYRLAVMFPFEWKWSAESNLWELDGSHVPDSASSVAKSARVVRGGWSTAELGQMGSPPFVIRCPGCATVQTVGAHRRKGTPSPGKPPVAESVANPRGRGLAGSGKSQPIAVFGHLGRSYR